MGSSRSPRREEHLLLVTAAQRRNRSVTTRCLDGESIDPGVGVATLCLALEPSVASVAADVADRGVLDHRHQREHSVGLAIGGDEGASGFEQVMRRVVVDRPTVHPDLTVRARLLARDQRHDVFASRPGDPGDSHDFTGPHIEVDLGDVAPSKRSCLEHDGPVWVRMEVAASLHDLVPDHQLDQPVVIQFGDRHGGDPAAVAEHADLVGDLEDLVEVVRHVEDRDAPSLQATDRLEEMVDIRCGQRRSRLVEDEEVSIVLPPDQRPSEGHRGLLGRSERRRPEGARRHLEAELVERCLRPAAIGTPVDPHPLPGEPVHQGQVLDGRQRVDKAEILVHEAQAIALGRPPVAELERLPTGSLP